MKSKNNEIKNNSPFLDNITFKKTSTYYKSFTPDYKQKLNHNKIRFSYNYLLLDDEKNSNKSSKNKNLKKIHNSERQRNKDELNIFLDRQKNDIIHKLGESFFPNINKNSKHNNLNLKNKTYNNIKVIQGNFNTIKNIKQKYYLNDNKKYELNKNKSVIGIKNNNKNISEASIFSIKKKITPKTLLNTQNSIPFNDKLFQNNFQDLPIQIIGKNNINKSNQRICNIYHKEIDLFDFRFHYNSHPTKIFNWLYLGSHMNACNLEDIEYIGINYVLNCAFECYDSYPSDIKYLHVNLNDSPYFKLIPHLNKITQFIHKAKISGGKILVHCQLGISRSTSCVIAYMIRYLGYTTLGALEFIRKRRPLVMPNSGFIQQLTSYERIVRNK